jgi:AraC-like DNA-binding protein
VKASDMQITSLDEKLIQNAILRVEHHISDPDFSVEDLSRELGMSRVHLYKKLLALTGKSPLEFIRTIRLQQAAQLLEKSQLTVSEVAYKVGFNNPKYFTKYFKEEYRVLPSAYAADKRGSVK